MLSDVNAAINAVYRLDWGWIVATLIRRFGDFDVAEEAAQEAFVAAVDQWRASGVPQVPRAWLLQTARHKAIDRIRRRRVRGETDLENVIPLHRDPAPGPGQIAWAGQVGQALATALSGLSDTDRAVVVMREMQGLPYEEIAATLGLPMGTLKAKLHRARERLRERLVEAGVAP